MERLPGVVGLVHGQPALLDDEPALSLSPFPRALRFTKYLLGRGRIDPRDEVIDSYVAAIRGSGADVVLAEYGTTGAQLVDACHLARVPLVVHFHGIDAYGKQILADYRVRYEAMFRSAGAIVAVSEHMRNQLLVLGAPEANLRLNVYGVDVGKFVQGGLPPSTPVFLAVGRMVEKKSPHLTILAFAKVVKQFPRAKLLWVGDGVLEGVCRTLVSALGLNDSIEFLGRIPHADIAQCMANATGFVQHSLTAIDGDSEGTPVAILEAMSAGLPVVSTRHAGIVDVVEEGKNGFLVDEGDVDEMAEAMLQLAEKPELVTQFGQRSRSIVSERYSMDRSIGRLTEIIRSVVDCR